ncbi:type IA DNA topoisomerase [Elizabethkingia anophelis]|uniref:type IA DNA topoisomerase n=1 Tax=Elizabethkingia anophelis TaxID=1117645 RepID=UPI001369EE93|nr:type IA DNA topoisomerase [Elizabethkingia anophelis]MYY43956.1 type IA DNA topoisomerase [Elizabethkingia anophelis]
MKLIIAEKPSVAREIAKILGVYDKNEGYLENKEYLVSWALGHLVGLGMPEDYGLEGFQKSNLPIIPPSYLLTPRKIKTNKSAALDPAAVKQLNILKNLMVQCSSIIVATDAGREGELIFRYIYQFLGSSKPFQRLWISSLTEVAIRKGFNELRPGREFDHLFQAARARSIADWLVGINATQAMTLALGDGIHSLGRVQTPTLALICSRYLENKNFISQKYYQIGLAHSKGHENFKSISEDKWEDKKIAEKALQSVQRHGSAAVAKIEKNTIKEAPPLLFNLTELQKEANKKLNFSAEETLNIAQDLYEKKFITYPRTGSRYIPEDLWPEIPDLIHSLENIASFKDAVGKINWRGLNKQMVNDVKVTDHHGLLITGKLPSALSVKENAIFEMIAFRLLEAVCGLCIKNSTAIHLEALHYKFIVRGTEIIDPGWRAIAGHFGDEKEENIQILPEFIEGEEVKIKSSGVLEKHTKAPALYTEATLLSAMESAGKKIENEDERRALQDIGIGTPATRASIIETLFTRAYVQRERKSLVPTEKGLKVYHNVRDKKIADIALTAQWEIKLQAIESGELQAEAFQKSAEDYAREITHELFTLSAHQEGPPEVICPQCKKQALILRDNIVKCPSQECNWHLFRNICGVQLQLVDIILLIQKGKTSLLKGMKSKSGKHFDAFMVLNDKKETVFEFPQSKPRFKK